MQLDKRFYIIFTIIIFTIQLSCFSQTPLSQSKTSLPKNLKWSIIEKEFYLQLNNLRKELKINELKYGDAILNLAANDQSEYMSANKSVGHTQKIKGKESPQKRVFYYNGTHDVIGENCLKTYINKPLKVKYSKKDVVISNEKEIATDLFLSWKNSPGHYQNMISPDYDIAGLGFSYGKDSSLYCTQVFSAFPYEQAKGFESPSDAFGIKEKNDGICQCMNSKTWDDIFSDLTIVFGADSVYLKCERYDLLKSFFNETGDAIYLDYVFRNQFVCAKNNLLHGSPIYDGCMTKPVLFKDLYKRNKGIGPKNFFATLCAIPKNLYNQKTEIGIDYGIVKKGYVCEYNYSISCPRKNLNILSLIPKWIDNPDLDIQPDTFKGIIKFNIPFARGIKEISESYKKEITKRLEIYKPFIKNIDIKTYSSIEGSTEVNIKLQTQRAENVKQYVLSLLNLTPNTTIESKENWGDFFNEIENTKFRDLTKLSKPDIKKALQQKTLLDSLDPILKKSRIASIEINITANIDNNSHPLLLLGAYQKSLDLGDSLRAFACQSKLISYLRKYQITNNDITQIVVPSTRKFISHLTNWIGLATNDDQMFYTSETRDKAILYQSIDTNYLPLQFNYCIMALKYIQQLGDTIIPISQLESKMKKCYKLKTSKDSMYVDYMFLNYNILTAYISNELHMYDKINKPLNEIKNYYIQHTLTESEALKLGLLFNLYGRVGWTLDLIKPLLVKYPTNEDLLFLYVETYFASTRETTENRENKALLAKARQMNKKRFTTWIDKDCFQLLRRADIKAEFCKP